MMHFSKMNSMLSVLALSTVGALGLASTASAACMTDTNCFDSYSGVMLGGTATFSGFGAGMFEGEEGGVLIEKEGGGYTSTNLNVAGDLCGIDCQDGSFTFDGGAFETVNVKAGAVGTISGTPVTVFNQGGAGSFVGFDFGKYSMPQTDTAE